MPTAAITPPKNTGSGRRPQLGKYTFAQWVEDTKKLTQDEIYAIEAQTQGLKEVKHSKAVTAKKPKRTPSKLPPRLKYPKWWKNLQPAGIGLSGPGSQKIVQGVSGFRSFITSIVFTVTGETTITLQFGSLGRSGPMNFGGENEPRGIALPMSDAPAPLGSGPFVLTSTGAGVAVNGFVVYYQEPDEVPS
jgi:hypothetical protein